MQILALKYGKLVTDRAKTPQLVLSTLLLYITFTLATQPWIT